MQHSLHYKGKRKYSDYKKRNARKFSASQCVTEDEFSRLTDLLGHYCGVPGPNGLDRVDNAQGYTNDNSVPCCKHCNCVKGKLSLSDFNEWTKQFVHFQTKKGPAYY